MLRELRLIRKHSVCLMVNALHSLLKVPIEKVFNKSLITKFHWAMDVDWQFAW